MELFPKDEKGMRRLTLLNSVAIIVVGCVYILDKVML